MRRLAVIFFLVVSMPLVASAFPFGGQVGTIIFCHNSAIYAAVGPPRGGPMIWTPETKTYQFGPPKYSGQWVLGLAAPPYYCLVSRSPIIVWSGILITMMGSSGRGAPAYNPQPADTGYPSIPTTPTLTPSPTPQPTPNTLPPSSSPVLPQNPTMGKLAMSEVFYSVDGTHGTDPEYEWVELYNGSTSTVDLTGWRISDSSATTTLPGNFRVGPNTFAMIIARAEVRNKWQIPSAVQIMTLGGTIGNGLANGGDSLKLYDRDGKLIDSLSWGGDKSVFNPAAPAVAAGHSMGRKTLEKDTHSVNDWGDLSQPTPGK